MQATTLRAALTPEFIPRPIAADTVRAGFPSPAQDYEEETLDINQYLVRNAPATFFVTVQGDSMIGAGIHDGDILVVDRSISPMHGHVVIAFVGGERLVKYFENYGSSGALVSAHPDFPPIQVNEENPATLWGVVIGRFAKVPA